MLIKSLSQAHILRYRNEHDGQIDEKHMDVRI
jgi:hypothetical protein